MIPKKIHYCWFGGNEKSKLAKKCINSWKKYCPDYEIIEWNESKQAVARIREILRDPKMINAFRDFKFPCTISLKLKIQLLLMKYKRADVLVVVGRSRM